MADNYKISLDWMGWLQPNTNTTIQVVKAGNGNGTSQLTAPLKFITADKYVFLKISTITITIINFIKHKSYKNYHQLFTNEYYQLQFDNLMKISILINRIPSTGTSSPHTLLLIIINLISITIVFIETFPHAGTSSPHHQSSQMLEEPLESLLPFSLSSE